MREAMVPICTTFVLQFVKRFSLISIEAYRFLCLKVCSCSLDTSLIYRIQFYSGKKSNVSKQETYIHVAHYKRVRRAYESSILLRCSVCMAMCIKIFLILLRILTEIQHRKCAR